MGNRPQITRLGQRTPGPFWRSPVVLLAIVLLVLVAVWQLASNKPEALSDPVVGPETRPENDSGPDLPAQTAAPTIPLAMPEQVEAPGRTFIAKLNLQPRLVNGRLSGFVVRPEDASILQGTPLQKGDVLLEVDGLPLDRARAAALAENVGDYQDVYVRFARGNTEFEGMLPLGLR